jgi:hypothetical protein
MPQLETTRNECVNTENQLAHLRSQRDKLQIERNTKIDEQIEKLEIVSSSHEYIEKLKEVGVNVDEKNIEFDVNFIDFSKNYSKVITLKNEIVTANMIDNQYEEVIEKLSNLNDSIQRIKKISESSNLSLKIWGIIKFYFIHEQSLDESESDFDFLKKILVKKMKNIDHDKLEFLFEIILGNEPVSGFFFKLESKKDQTGEKFVDDEIEKLDGEIEDLKNDLSKENDPDEKNSLKDQITRIKREKEKIRNNKREIKLVFNTMNQIRIEVKEKFIQELIKKDLMELYKSIAVDYFPAIENMKAEYQLAIKD